MASKTKKPDKVLGMHFFNPVPVMPLLEMVHSFITSDSTYETSRQLGESLGKQVIVAKDRPGLSSTRSSSPFNSTPSVFSKTVWRPKRTLTRASVSD